MTTAKDLGEAGLIRCFAALESGPHPEFILDLENGDDAAAWRAAPGYTSVITTDSAVEGGHFRLDFSPPEFVGEKLMHMNLSDLAAMGARGRLALLSVCIPGPTPAAVIEGLARGIHRVCRAEQLTILGGNVTSTRGPIVLTATLIGAARPAQLLRRAGARPGEALFVTGTLGDALGGLQRLLDGRRLGFEEPSGWAPALDPGGPPVAPTPGEQAFAPLYRAQLAPRARTQAGLQLAETGLVSAMCDISDGLGQDLKNMLGPEGLGATVELSRLPCSPALLAHAAESARDPQQLALAGGEEYELLLSAPAEAEAQLAAAVAPLPLTRVGWVRAGGRFNSVGAGGAAADFPESFQHY